MSRRLDRSLIAAGAATLDGAPEAKPSQTVAPGASTRDCGF